jgi:hypothetical protein
MTPEQRLAKATRAQAALDEFLSPMFAEMEAEYSSRIIEVANTELLFWRRASKLTRLSDALRMVRTLRAGMQAIIADGDAAQSEKIRQDKIRQMTEPQRRLLKIGTGY